MNINITEFSLFNVVDSCSVWNILSSAKLYSTSLSAGCYYSFTKYVEYECLRKVRKSLSTSDQSQKDFLEKEMAKNKFQSHAISIDDLQAIGLLEERKKLGKGELSSIVFAKKTNQTFLTDDKAARALAVTILGSSRVQTTPHLAGFLFYKRFLIDGDLSVILNEHNAIATNNWGKLGSFFTEVYNESLRIRLMEGSDNSEW